MGRTEFLLAEYEHFSESLWKNEEVGERRVNFFITLLTAVIAALVTLWTKVGTEPGSLSGDAVLKITYGALAGLLLFGLVTFMRMLQRNHVTDEYKGIVAALRRRLAATAELEQYELPFRSSRHWLVRGGLAPTVAMMNAAIGAVIGWLARPGGEPWFGAVIGFALVLVVQLPGISGRK